MLSFNQNRNGGGKWRGGPPAGYRRSGGGGGVVLAVTVYAVVLVVISMVGTSAAATTGRKQSHIVDQVNVGKSKTGKVMEPAFANAGKVAGLEIWRIEDFKPVAYPKNEFGKFYSGDSYIVLFTKDKNHKISWDIHFWLGSQTSQDEAGSAAILTVQLDEQLGGTPVQYREVQDHESQLFLSHFKNGVRYLPGGIASGFSHVDRNQHEKKLYQVKGKKNIRIKQVDLTIASMNKGDCFILDIGSEVFVYVGSDAKRVERLKAITGGNVIRDQDHGGRSKVTIIDEFSPEDEYDSYFNALGAGSKDAVPDESAGGDDDLFEKSQEKQIALYKVSDASGSIKVEPLSEKPLLQAMLNTNDCFILDTTDSNLYVWVGKKCTATEKNESMKRAQQFLTSKNYPAWTQVTRVVEGAEPSAFQQYFKTWKGTGEIHTRLIRSMNVKPPTKLENKSQGAVQDFMPDNGSGEVEVFRVEDFELSPVPEATYGKFFGGDSYVIKYRYGPKYIIYIWQGEKSTNDEKAASAIHAVEMDNGLGGVATQIRITQNNEPKHFLHIFKGKLITFLGGKASGFKNINDHDTYSKGETRVFRIRGTNSENVRASQQVATSKSLESDDVFIVENDDRAWIWQGKESDEIERELASNFAKQIVPETVPEVIKEGSEPKEFWDLLHGQEAYSEKYEEPTVSEPKLFHAVLNKNNRLKLEEINDFEQEDLVEDDVMLLDTGYEMFIWIGITADTVERKTAHKIAQKYIEKYHRNHYVTLVVKQGHEPEAFTSVFDSWNADLWDTTPTYEQAKARFQ